MPIWLAEVHVRGKVEVARAGRLGFSGIVGQYHYLTLNEGVTESSP
jgi:hypothetical protein